MADGITVSSDVLSSTATKIRSINAQLKAKLTACNQQVNNLSSTWQSDAGSDIRSAMDALKPRFDEYESVIEAYAKFLDNTALNYENMETVLQSNANLFK